MPHAPLGILMLNTQFPRIPGDVGNPDSYDFPILTRVVRGATVQRVVFEADPTLIDEFIHGAQELEAVGVWGITSTCGFLTPLQAEVAQSVRVPVFLSSLLQVPLAQAATQGRIGILTANAHSLTEEVLQAAGISRDAPLAVRGLQDEPAFRDPILHNGNSLRRDDIERAAVRLAEDILHEHADVSAFVLECHNLAPYAAAVCRATGKPVYDIIDFAHWMHATVHKRSFAAQPEPRERG